MLGLSGGAGGTGFAGPQLAPVASGVNADQAESSYKANQDALAQQQRLVQALQAQNGLGNQSQVFGQNQGLYNQLQGIAAGQGPNPAQAMLNQATGQNVANQAALMAGQRGAGANVGLLARQAGQQGGALQQNAAGQAAVMQANQSLGALGQAQGVLGQAGNIAGNQAANQIGAQQAYTGAQQAQYGNVLNALGQQNQANISNQASVNAANAGLTQTGMQGQQGLVGGLLNAAGVAAGLPGGKAKAYGGEIAGYANGGPVGAQSSFGQFLTTVSGPSGGGSIPMPPPASGGPVKPLFGQDWGSKSPPSAPPPGAESEGFKTSGVEGAYYPAQNKGGLVDVVLSPGEKVVAPKDVKAAAGGKVKAKTVPGKTEVKGDSLKNDKVPAKLAPGSVVVPRTKAKDGRDASSFVKDTLAKRGRGK